MSHIMENKYVILIHWFILLGSQVTISKLGGLFIPDTLSNSADVDEMLHSSRSTLLIKVLAYSFNVS